MIISAGEKAGGPFVHSYFYMHCCTFLITSHHWSALPQWSQLSRLSCTNKYYLDTSFSDLNRHMDSFLFSMLHDWWSSYWTSKTNYSVYHSTTTTNCWRCCNNCLFGLRLLSHFRLVFLCRSHNIGEYCQIFSLHPTTPGSISLTGRLGAVVTWSHTTSIAPIPNSYLTVRLLYVWWTKERNNFCENWKIVKLLSMRRILWDLINLTRTTNHLLILLLKIFIFYFTDLHSIISLLETNCHQ